MLGGGGGKSPKKITQGRATEKREKKQSCQGEVKEKKFCRVNCTQSGLQILFA